MFNIAKRNVKLFFRDRTAIFFSFLTVIIIIGLYVLFLGNLIANQYSGFPHARFLVDSWVVSGLVASCSVTATLGAFAVIINDYKRNIIKDFKSSPIKFSQLTAGYILSAFVIGIILSFFTLILGQIYIIVNGGQLLSLKSYGLVILVVMLSTFMNSAVLFFIISFVKSESAYSTISTVIGTVIGFLLGIYIPYGGLPSYIQSIMKVFPGSYSASLLRMIILEKPMSMVFENADQTHIDSFIINMGVRFQINDTLTTPLIAILVMVGTGILFFVLSILKLSIKAK